MRSPWATSVASDRVGSPRPTTYRTSRARRRSRRYGGDLCIAQGGFARGHPAFPRGCAKSTSADQGARADCKLVDYWKVISDPTRIGPLPSPATSTEGRAVCPAGFRNRPQGEAGCALSRISRSPAKKCLWNLLVGIVLFFDLAANANLRRTAKPGRIVRKRNRNAQTTTGFV